MKPVLLPAVLCAALVACTADAPPAAPAAVTAATPAAAVRPPAEPTPAAPAQHRFAFAERSAAPGPSGVTIVGTEPTPCGPVLVARVDRIPLDDARVRPDWVVEFDAAGAQVRRWGVPHEALVVGLDGDRVRFRTASGTYRVDAAGAVEQVDGPGIDAAQPRPASLLDGGAAVTCPAAITADGADLRCATVRDAAGVDRRLAVPTVCS